MTKWILVAHRSGARLFEQSGEDPPRELWAIDHPDGRLMNQEIDSDRPGQVSERSNPFRSSMSHEQSAKEHLAESFAKALASRLDRDRNLNHYDDLVLVAEARFLGLLKRELSAATLASVRNTFDKDLAHVPVLKLKQHLMEMTVSANAEEIETSRSSAPTR